MTQPALIPVRSNEAAMVAMLRRRYNVRGPTGLPQWICVSGLRNSASFATGTCDFVAMGMSNYRRNPLHGHEIKVSRSDWLRELKQPWKAELFRPFMDYWWLVVAGQGIVRLNELPDGWGLIAPSPNRRGLVTLHQAKRADPAPMPKPMMACFLRRAVEQAALQ